jgi:hypothetical protein
VFEPLAYFHHRQLRDALKRFLCTYEAWSEQDTEIRRASVYEAVPDAAEAFDEMKLHMVSVPAPAVGGAVIHINVAREALNADLADARDLTPENVGHFTGNFGDTLLNCH